MLKKILLSSLCCFSVQADDFLNKAWQSYVAGDFDLSKQQLQKSSAGKSVKRDLLKSLLNPESKKRVLQDLTNAYKALLSKGKLDESLSQAEFLLTINPENEEIAKLYTLSLKKLDRNFYAYAFLQNYLSGIKDLPDEWSLLLNEVKTEAEALKALTLIKVDNAIAASRLDDALTDLNRIGLAFPNDYETHEKICLIYALQGKRNSAIRAFELAIRSDFSAAGKLAKTNTILLKLLVEEDFQKIIKSSYGENFLSELKQRTVELGAVRYRFIQSGIFSRMDGSVKLPKSFWISECELSVEEYEKHMSLPQQKLTLTIEKEEQLFKELPEFDIAISDEFQEEGAEATKPVVNISWNTAVKFCHKVSSSSAFNFRLPTEEEWEYACRANSTYDYSFGDKASVDEANFTLLKRYGEDTRPEGIKIVGSYSANGFGLYDMHGNVAEWTASSWRALVYGETNKEDKLAKVGDKVVVKGGSYLQDQEGVKSASRLRLDSYSSKMWVGFRLIIE